MDKKKIKWYVLGAVVVFVVFKLGFWMWDISDSASVARGEYQALSLHAKAQEKLRLKTIADLTKANEKQDIVIKGLNGDVIKAKKERIAIEGKVSDLVGKLAVAKTDAEKVVILTTEVGHLNEIIGLADAVIVAREKEANAWAVKFNNQVKVTGEYIELWKAEKARADAAESWAKELQHALKVSRIGSRIKTGIVIGVSGYIFYSLVKGK